ncbi:MAG: glutamate--tRNA ligase [Caldilineaceae bacterium]|nr:glutamate--tRNA ligase [Caldilineaceae bacterium]MBP8107182.1 glutamate--tRNA ligase [Caldilineaceae bacterium]MBP8122217.1 glutamate--tRNA ligase [Caldilineaceae bacterium]MBP9072788.1 glutamate--tRNA ligase [Caldilineaceae bacterium]
MTSNNALSSADPIRPARTRFAPSPTGFLHAGSLRTALFAWLWAKHTGGTFILRIEDTDQKRLNPESLQNIMAGLRWLGLDWDEGPEVGGPFGPYIQTERKELYAPYAEQLVESGHAYKCYCSAERLADLREEQQRAKQPTGYDRHCRNLTAEERAEQEAAGIVPVVRLAVPLTGSTTFNDLIRGDITTDNGQLQDMVLLKSDGLPTYHLAVVVDDQLMQITDILRGEEWLASAPIHQLIHDAFGWTAPRFVHLPVILDPSGKGKMSKRKKVVAGKEYLVMVNEFIEAGYLPEALFNLLANVGWSYDGETDLFTRAEAIARFDVADINPSPAAMPYGKLDSFNGTYMRGLTPADLKARLVPFLAGPLGITEAELAASDKLDKLAPIIQERLVTLKDAIDWVDWAFVDADAITYPDTSQLLGKKLDAAQSAAVLQAGAEILATVEPFDAEAIHEAFRVKSEEMGVKAGSFFGPFRVAVTGKKVSPPLFESMDVLGRQEVLRRVENATRALQQG